MDKPTTRPDHGGNTTTAGESIWNRDAALANAGSDQEVAELIHAEFLRTLPDSEAALTLACGQGDHDELAKQGHRLAGAAALVGADGVRIGCLALSRLLKTGPSPDALALQVKALLRETARFRSVAKASAMDTQEE